MRKFSLYPKNKKKINKYKSELKKETVSIIVFNPSLDSIYYSHSGSKIFSII